MKELIDKDSDRVRFNNLGDNYKSKDQHMGAKGSRDLGDLLIL